MMNPWFAKEVRQVLTTGQGDLPQGDGSMLLRALSPGGRSRGPVVPWLLPHRQIKLNKVTKVAIWESLRPKPAGGLGCGREGGGREVRGLEKPRPGDQLHPEQTVCSQGTAGPRGSGASFLLLLP